jgi:hypothetical protein
MNREWLVFQSGLVDLGRPGLCDTHCAEPRRQQTVQIAVLALQALHVQHQFGSAVVGAICGADVRQKWKLEERPIRSANSARFPCKHDFMLRACVMKGIFQTSMQLKIFKDENQRRESNSDRRQNQSEYANTLQRTFQQSMNDMHLINDQANVQRRCFL